MNDPAPLANAGASVSITALAPFLRLLEEAGPDVVARTAERSEQLFARWGISLAELEADLTLRLPHALMVELNQMFIEMLDDPSASLRAGTKLQPGDYELLEYLCGTCGTLGESMACLGRYYALLAPAELETVVDGERAEARFRIAPGLDAPDSFHEFGMASNFTMSILHLDLNGAQMPLEVCFAHKAPSYADLFPQLFLAPVRFECEHNAIVFPVAMLEHRMRSADPLLHAVLARQADRELAALSDQSAFPLKVREAIDAELAQGAPLADVARRLHMSASALRSRLRQHGTSYSALLDRIRRDHAKRALRQSQISFAEVAHQLGFAHPPAFHRAFRRWFGLTPSAYRETARSRPASRFFRRDGGGTTGSGS